MDPADCIATLLRTSNVEINGWAISVSKQPEDPNRSIAVYNSGGRPASPRWNVDYPTVRIRVRGFPNSYQESRKKAQECKSVLLGIGGTDFPSVDYPGKNDRIVSITLQTDIMDAGYDQSNRPLHVINFYLITQPVADGNRIEIPPIGMAPP